MVVYLEVTFLVPREDAPRWIQAARPPLVSGAKNREETPTPQEVAGGATRGRKYTSDKVPQILSGQVNEEHPVIGARCG